MSKLPIKKSTSTVAIRLPTQLQMLILKLNYLIVLRCRTTQYFFITDICIPYLWRTVDLNVNDHIYFSVGTPAPSFPFTVSFQNYTGIIPAGNYGESDLAAAINSVVSTLTNGTINATFNTGTSVVTIITTNPQATFRIFTDTEVINTLQIGNPMSINEIILNIGNPLFLSFISSKL